MIPRKKTVTTSKYEAVFALVSTMTVGAVLGIGWGLYRIKKERDKIEDHE